METKYLNIEPVKEFYIIKYGNVKHIVSAIGFNGGYVYYLIEGNGDFFDETFIPKITPISDILQYCKPDAEIISIEENNPKTKNTYRKLCHYIEEFANLNKEQVK